MAMRSPANRHSRELVKGDTLKVVKSNNRYALRGYREGDICYFDSIYRVGVYADAQTLINVTRPGCVGVCFYYFRVEAKKSPDWWDIWAPEEN